VSPAIASVTILSVGTTLPSSRERHGGAPRARLARRRQHPRLVRVQRARRDGAPRRIGGVDVPEALRHFALPFVGAVSLLFYLLTQDKRISRWEGLLSSSLPALPVQGHGVADGAGPAPRPPRPHPPRHRPRACPAFAPPPRLRRRAPPPARRGPSRARASPPAGRHRRPAAARPSAVRAGASRAPRPRRPRGAGDSAALALQRAPAPAVRALYVNRFASQSAARMRHLVALADSTEVNALVVDMKDEFGLNYQSANAEFARNAGAMGKLRNVRALVDTLRAHGVLPIARIVVFKDSVTARVHPSGRSAAPTARRGATTRGWRGSTRTTGRCGTTTSAWPRSSCGLGFGEVQFDYIRFPEPYRSLPPQVFPDDRGQKKPDASPSS
jgi:hypothetical protein